MRYQFEIAGGSIVGNDHLQANRNNQDAFHWFQREGCLAAVVCDGCGSGHHSEVGAKIGAKLIIESIHQQLQYTDTLTEETACSLLEHTRTYTLQRLLTIANAMSGDREKELINVILNYFLFTVVGVMGVNDWLISFSLGDGVFVIDGEVHQLGPFPKNEPPYLTYGLIPSLDDPEFQIHQAGLENVQSILIGTDGVDDLIKIADKHLPGKTETVGELSQFWQDDRYFQNADMVRRKLALINRIHTRPDWENHRLIKTQGLLPDDTTLIVMRKRGA